MTKIIVLIGLWLLLPCVAVIAWAVYQEIAWRWWQRRRRPSDELTIDLTRKVRQ